MAASPKKIVMTLVETQKNFGDAAAMQGMREPEVPLSSMG